MEYAIYKLAFKTGVHFGNGALSSNAISFLADNLFSALYIEALKFGQNDELYSLCVDGELLISDAFPYIADRYFLPKPNIYIEPKDRGNSSLKKAYKKLKFIPAELMGDYLGGQLDPNVCSISQLGAGSEQIMAAMGRDGEDTKPFSVGTFYFADGNGLYVIFAYKDNAVRELLEELMEGLSYTGIGGKRSAGKGKFEFRIANKADALMRLMQQKTGRYMLLSTALPKYTELDDALLSASYLMQRRAGFIYSDNYADTLVKKNDLYTMQSGSCFTNPFKGDIYDVSGGLGAHPVYRYAKAMFMEV